MDQNGRLSQGKGSGPGSHPPGAQNSSLNVVQGQDAAMSGGFTSQMAQLNPQQQRQLLMMQQSKQLQQVQNQQLLHSQSQPLHSHSHTQMQQLQLQQQQLQLQQQLQFQQQQQQQHQQQQQSQSQGQTPMNQFQPNRSHLQSLGGGISSQFVTRAAAPNQSQSQSQAQAQPALASHPTNQQQQIQMQQILAQQQYQQQLYQQQQLQQQLHQQQTRGQTSIANTSNLANNAGDAQLMNSSNLARNSMSSNFPKGMSLSQQQQQMQLLQIQKQQQLQQHFLRQQNEFSQQSSSHPSSPPIQNHTLSSSPIPTSVISKSLSSSALPEYNRQQLPPRSTTMSVGEISPLTFGSDDWLGIGSSANMQQHQNTIQLQAQMQQARQIQQAQQAQQLRQQQQHQQQRQISQSGATISISNPLTMDFGNPPFLPLDTDLSSFVPSAPLARKNSVVAHPSPAQPQASEPALNAIEVERASSQYLSTSQQTLLPQAPKPIKNFIGLTPQDLHSEILQFHIWTASRIDSYQLDKYVKNKNLIVPEYEGYGPLDLWLLFNSVIERGGGENVSKKSRWPEVVSILSLPEDAYRAVASTYRDFLFGYERVFIQFRQTGIPGKIMSKVIERVEKAKRRSQSPMVSSPPGSQPDAPKSTKYRTLLSTPSTNTEPLPYIPSILHLSKTYGGLDIAAFLHHRTASDIRLGPEWTSGVLDMKRVLLSLCSGMIADVTYAVNVLLVWSVAGNLLDIRPENTGNLIQILCGLLQAHSKTYTLNPTFNSRPDCTQNIDKDKDKDKDNDNDNGAHSPNSRHGILDLIHLVRESQFHFLTNPKNTLDPTLYSMELSLAIGRILMNFSAGVAVNCGRLAEMDDVHCCVIEMLCADFPDYLVSRNDYDSDSDSNDFEKCGFETSNLAVNVLLQRRHALTILACFGPRVHLWAPAYSGKLAEVLESILDFIVDGDETWSGLAVETLCKITTEYSNRDLFARAEGIDWNRIIDALASIVLRRSKGLFDLDIPTAEYVHLYYALLTLRNFAEMDIDTIRIRCCRQDLAHLFLRFSKFCATSIPINVRTQSPWHDFKIFPAQILLAASKSELARKKLVILEEPIFSFLIQKHLDHNDYLRIILSELLNRIQTSNTTIPVTIGLQVKPLVRR